MSTSQRCLVKSQHRVPERHKLVALDCGSLEGITLPCNAAVVYMCCMPSWQACNSMKSAVADRCTMLHAGWAGHSDITLFHGSDRHAVWHPLAASLCSNGQLDSLPHEHAVHGAYKQDRKSKSIGNRTHECSRQVGLECMLVKAKSEWHAVFACHT